MTWEQTHERYRLLNRAEEILRSDPEGRLPWGEEYAAAYASPDALAQALRHRWRIRFEAADDPELAADVRDGLLARMRRDRPALLPWVGARPSYAASELPASA